jgi:hypothetical protein
MRSPVVVEKLDIHERHDFGGWQMSLAPLQISYRGILTRRYFGPLPLPELFSTPVLAN